MINQMRILFFSNRSALMYTLLNCLSLSLWLYEEPSDDNQKNADKKFQMSSVHGLIMSALIVTELLLDK